MNRTKLPAKFFKGYMTLRPTEKTVKGKGTHDYFDFQGRDSMGRYMRRLTKIYAR